MEATRFGVGGLFGGRFPGLTLRANHSLDEEFRWGFSGTAGKPGFRLEWDHERLKRGQEEAASPQCFHGGSGKSLPPRALLAVANEG
jgi:hypothetical protein